MNARIAVAALAVTASALLAGCASMEGVTPQAAPRRADALATQRTLAGARVSSAAWPESDWWKAFHDAQLDALMDEALADSPTLNIAAARTRKALAAAGVSKAALLPQVDGVAASTRQRFSENGLVPPPLGGTTQTFNQLQLTLSWEIDFWGRNRAAYEAALGNARTATLQGGGRIGVRDHHVVAQQRTKRAGPPRTRSRWGRRCSSHRYALVARHVPQPRLTPSTSSPARGG